MIFQNIFLSIDATTRIDFTQLANCRRAILEKAGIDTSHTNWELYAEVLKAKHQLLKNS